MFLADNRRHQISAERGARHQQVALVRNGQRRTVGCKSGLYLCRDTRAQIAPDRRRSDKQDFRLVGLDQVDNGLRVWLHQIIFQFGRVDDQHPINARFDQALCQGEYLIAEQQRPECYFTQSQH